jgi:competence protein ComEA
MFPWIKDLYAEFTPRTIKVTITLLAIVGFAVYVASSGTTSSKTIQVSKSITSNKVTSPKIYVHVAGLVRKPGIYQLDSGSRVYDAVLLAGGFLPKAEQTSVNLARVLNDGEQLLIQAIGKTSYLESGSSNLISINQASSQVLEQLPGVGPQLASRIVDWREANGGFSRKEDLLNVAGIGDKLFAAVKDLITL